MNTHLAINYEHDLNLYVVERKVNSYFDWISAVGGVFGGLRILLRGIVGFLSYNAFSVYMVSKLYKPEEEEAKKNPKKLKSPRTIEIEN